MPTNCTEHYQLSQWEPGDRVLRTDFNADNAKIDAALAAETQARVSADAEIRTVLNTMGNCRVETLTYTGNGEESVSISFSGMPRFYVIYSTNGFTVGNGMPENGIWTITHNPTSGVQQWFPPVKSSWEGNTLTIFGVNQQSAVSNYPGFVYYVTAFYAEDEA